MPGGPAATAANGKSRPCKDAREDAGDEPPKRSSPSTCRLACRRTLRSVIRMVAAVIDQGVRGFHVVMKIIGPCFICLALGLIGFCTYTYFTYLLPVMEDTWGLSGQIAITCLGLYLVSNAVYNYLMAVSTDPGLPPEWDEALVQKDSEELSEPPPKQCKHCGRLKPERCHHCSICRRCVLKMDHHCPWINNCVGHNNYRHFTLFMLFLAMSCVFVVCTFFPVFHDGMFNVRSKRHYTLPRSGRSSIMTSFMISCSILVALSVLGGFHVYLVLTNQSTIEFQLNLLKRREARRNGEYFRNPYDMGRRRNFAAVFGPNPFCHFLWLMPYFSQASSGDGMSFNSISSMKT